MAPSISGKFAHPWVTISFGLFDREDEDTDFRNILNSLQIGTA